MSATNDQRRLARYLYTLGQTRRRPAAPVTEPPPLYRRVGRGIERRLRGTATLRGLLEDATAAGVPARG